MRTIAALLIFIAFVAAPAAAQIGADGVVGVQCAPDKAVWASPFGEGAYDETDASGWQTYEGVRTSTWTCAVDKRRLVVRFYSTHPDHECSAMGSVLVSAWVDGFKVVSREEAGEAPYCLGGSSLSSITLTARGGVALCRSTWEEPYADTPTKSCERLSLKAIRKIGRDPNYVPPGAQTSWAYDLHYGDAAFCAPYTSRLTRVPWEELEGPDPAFADLAVPGTENWMNTWVEPDQGRPLLTAEFDADNDGVLDAVTLDSVQKNQGRTMAELRWQKKGASGEPFIAGEIFDRDDGIAKRDNPYVTGYIAQLVRPIKIGGKTYIYVRRHEAFQGDTVSEEQMASEDNPTSLSRGLIELHPDGRTTVKCGWGPRPRPEEFL